MLLYYDGRRSPSDVTLEKSYMCWNTLLVIYSTKITKLFVVEYITLEVSLGILS